MLPVFLFFTAVIAAILHLIVTKKWESWERFFLTYVIFFNVGVMGCLSFFAHTFMAEEIANGIGFPPGNPFQQEVGSAGLAFGVLGLLSYRFQGLFWNATIIGNAVFLLGCFFFHIIQYLKGNTAPFNIGIFVWFNDLFIPLFLLGSLYWLSQREKPLST